MGRAGAKSPPVAKAVEVLGHTLLRRLDDSDKDVRVAASWALRPLFCVVQGASYDNMIRAVAEHAVSAETEEESDLLADAVREGALHNLSSAMGVLKTLDQRSQVAADMLDHAVTVAALRGTS